MWFNMKQNRYVDVFTEFHILIHSIQCELFVQIGYVIHIILQIEPATLKYLKLYNDLALGNYGIKYKNFFNDM